MNYQPQGCNSCPYASECLHAKNMILTAKPRRSTILQTTRKEYVSVKEAESDLKEKFLQAVYSEYHGVHIIVAQTGIGKTNLYLDYLCQNTGKTFLIAVPTHKLKMEVYHKTISKGIRNIVYTPEMPEFSPEIQEKIKHIYEIGAGRYALKMMSEIREKIPQDYPDYIALRNYLDTLEIIKNFKGHIITTHDRLLLQKKNIRICQMERDWLNVMTVG